MASTPHPARKPADGKRSPAKPATATTGRSVGAKARAGAQAGARRAAPGAPRKAPKAAKAATAKAVRAKRVGTKAAGTKAAGAKPFGRAGTAGKGDGHTAVQAWLAGVKPEHRGLVQRLDRLVGETVPGVRRAVKWSMPMYGLPGKGWFAHLASFKGHVRLGFFAGSSLDPEPPEGEGKTMRAVHLRGAKDLDEALVRSWLRQAAAGKGWGSVA